MADLDRLRQLTLDAIGPALGGSIGAFRRTMAQAIQRAHTAAYVAGTAERLGTTPNAIRGLSRAERKDLQKAVDAQLKYLDGFAADLKAGKLTPAQANARAALYAGPARTTYSQARFPNLPFYPGQGTECKGNCRCSWEQHEEGYYWRLGAAEHCPTCVSRESGNPYRV